LFPFIVPRISASPPADRKGSRATPSLMKILQNYYQSDHQLARQEAEFWVISGSELTKRGVVEIAVIQQFLGSIAKPLI
jgi:hypothetical protein